MAIRSSARENYIEQGGRDLDEYLIREHAIWTRDAENTFENRRREWINLGLTIATLPTEIANLKLAGEGTRAMIASTWNSIDIANKMMEIDMTYADLSALQSLYAFATKDQEQDEREIQAAFLNALRGTDPVDPNDLLGILFGFTGESTEAIIEQPR